MSAPSAFTSKSLTTETGSATKNPAVNITKMDSRSATPNPDIPKPRAGNIIQVKNVKNAIALAENPLGKDTNKPPTLKEGYQVAFPMSNSINEITFTSAQLIFHASKRFEPTTAHYAVRVRFRKLHGQKEAAAVCQHTSEMRGAQLPPLNRAAYGTREKQLVSGPDGHHFLIAGKPEYIGQVLASLAVSLGPLAAGLGKGYSSPAIASLQERDADAFLVNGQQASWLASLSLLGALFGAPLGGAAVRWGRRRTLLYAGMPLSLCWIITVFSVSVEVMCLAAFVSGFLVAIVQLSAQVYVSEIATPSIRGGLSALLKIAGHAGVLVAFAAGAFLDWRQLAGLISLAPAAMCLAMWRVPESPGWLVLRGRLHEAEEALRWFRGENADLRLELSVLQAHVSNKTVPVSPTLLIHNLKTPVFIACGLMFFQRFSGANAFNFYVVSVFKETFGGTNPHSAAVAVAVVQLLSSLLSGLW
ncbi:hypothetical protein WA026_013432 [Henosepilachna vigintioctopunctata]|uniref:Major facilitator superfamily (MFS) profile domain-containing protein n=1 Tax=Henosepilachna vigintioctopunctata TaxID=420089 RepID=A0AAW1V7J3_9CUCU